MRRIATIGLADVLATTPAAVTDRVPGPILRLFAVAMIAFIGAVRFVAMRSGTRE